MYDLNVKLVLDDESEKMFEDYLEKNNLSEEEGVKNIFALGLSYYRGRIKVEELKDGEGFQKSLVNELILSNSRYSSLKFNYFEMKKDYDRVILQNSGLINAINRYKVSHQSLLDQIKEQEVKLARVEV